VRRGLVKYVGSYRRGGDLDDELVSGLMDFLSKLKAKLSDYRKVAEKDAFVVDLGGETYVYPPALCACRSDGTLEEHGGGLVEPTPGVQVAGLGLYDTAGNLRGPSWSETVSGSQAWASSTADITSELMEM
jgi:hypothetical protein